LNCTDTTLQYVELVVAQNKSYLLDLSQEGVIALSDVAGNALIVTNESISLVTANCTLELNIPYSNLSSQTNSSNTSAAPSLVHRGLQPCIDNVDAETSAFGRACEIWDAFETYFEVVEKVIPIIGEAIELEVLASGPVVVGIFGAFWGISHAMNWMCTSAKLLHVATEPFGVNPAQWYACHVCGPIHGSCPAAS
jgi:hypothetical protein